MKAVLILIGIILIAAAAWVFFRGIQGETPDKLIPIGLAVVGGVIAFAGFAKKSE